MLKEILLCTEAVFCMIGIIFSAKYIFGQICKKSRSAPKFTFGISDNPDSIEGTVRQLIKSFPDSEILILDAGSEEESKEIIHKLCKDFGCVKYMGLFK